MSNSDGNQVALLPPPTAPAPPVKLSRGQLIALMDPADLDAAVMSKLTALSALLDDEKIPTETRDKIRALRDVANPNKPGMEEAEAAWKVPRLLIHQPTTQNEMKPDSAKQGDLFTTAGQLLERPLGIIVLYIFKENINFPKNSKIPLCYSPDGKTGSPFGECLKCPHLPYGLQNGGKGDQTQTDCQNNIVIVALTADLKQVCVIQFGKTSRKAGAALTTLAGQQGAVWKQSYLVDTEKKTGEVGVYYVYKTAPTGKDNSEDVTRLANALYDLFVAERDRALHAHYTRQASAPAVAAEIEGAFSGGGLDAGLADGVEPDLSTPAPATIAAAGATTAATTGATKPTTTTSKARGSAKPM